MSPIESPAIAPTLASISYVTIVAQIRRLLIVAFVSGIAYALLLHASKGYCPGGIGADGGFTDAVGNPVAAAPQCVSLTLAPSAAVYAAIAAIVIMAITRVIRSTPDEVAASRTLTRAAATLVILVVASIVIAQVWFALIPITDWSATGSFAFYYPFPFGGVDLAIAPMGGP